MGGTAVGRVLTDSATDGDGVEWHTELGRQQIVVAFHTRNTQLERHLHLLHTRNTDASLYTQNFEQSCSKYLYLKYKYKYKYLGPKYKYKYKYFGAKYKYKYKYFGPKYKYK
jgi:hypothetical protein